MTTHTRTAATVAITLAALLLLPLVSAFPQLATEAAVVFDADDDIGPRFQASGASANELHRSTRYPGGWGQPLYLPTTPKPAPPSFVDYEEVYIFDRPEKPFDFVRRTTTPAPTTKGGTTRQDCDCPATNEYNPVCGTDLVTYSNPGHLYCAKYCGKQVGIYHVGKCMTTTTERPNSVLK